MTDVLRRFQAGIIRALARPARTAGVELLRDEGEVPVGRVHEALGVEQANASRHLVVPVRTEGIQDRYRLRDERPGAVLDLREPSFHDHPAESMALPRGGRAEKART